MNYQFEAGFARLQDEQDPLNKYRQQFHFPQVDHKDSIYFTGNSLGLQPKKAAQMVNEELQDWAELGVEGHVHSRRPWLKYHEFFTEALANVVGSKPAEVVAMNGLTTNLHLLMVSFFRPSANRTKILCEGKAFPSDQYALKSQLRYHGLDESHLLEVMPDPDTDLLDVDKILNVIKEQGEEIAMLMMGGVNYYSGQVLPMQEITKAAQAKGITVGWDLAHGAGNIPLKLHDWGVDFAAWCGYKYLNSGPGGVSGVFIHQRHHDTKDIPRFEGWWGHDKESRFAMPDEFAPIPTAEAWQLSNAPVLAMAPLLASLELFEEVGIADLRKKSEKLTGYLEFVIHQVESRSQAGLKIITPTSTEERGCQISLIVPEIGKMVFDEMSKNGVIADWREPDVIRVAPVPLYNSFNDVYQFGKILEECLKRK